MIVVILIGIVYSLVIGNLNPKNRLNIPRLETLKESLLPYWHKGSRLDLYLYDHCKKYLIKIDGEVPEKLKIKLDPKLFKDIEVYRIDPFFDPQEVYFPPLLHDKEVHDICFQFTIYPNKSSSSYIVKQNRRYYLFYPYLHPVEILSSMEEAIDKLSNRNFSRITSHDIQE